MYKFTNGIVVFDKETRDKYINAGMTLVEEKKADEEKNRPNRLEEHRGTEEGTESRNMDAGIPKNNKKVSK